MKSRRLIQPEFADPFIPLPAPQEKAPQVEVEAVGGRLSVDARVMVTPAMALEWLGGQARNRNLRKTRVTELAGEILAGRWETTGEALKFSLTGKLVDGQHRLEALLLAAETLPELELPFTVVRNVPDSARRVMDTGARRTASDNLKIAGHPNNVMLAAATKWVILFERDAFYVDKAFRTVTSAEIVEYVEDPAHTILEEICMIVMNKLNKHIDMPPGCTGAGYYICARIDRDLADHFFARLADGVLLNEGDPILALRRRLFLLERQKTTLPGEMYLGAIFRAWNACRGAKKLDVLPLYKAKVPLKAPRPR